MFFVAITLIKLIWKTFEILPTVFKFIGPNTRRLFIFSLVKKVTVLRLSNAIYIPHTSHSLTAVYDYSVV